MFFIPNVVQVCSILVLHRIDRQTSFLELLLSQFTAQATRWAGAAGDMAVVRAFSNQ